MWVAAVEGTAGLLLQECQSLLRAGLPLVLHGVRAAPVLVPLSKMSSSSWGPSGDHGVLGPHLCVFCWGWCLFIKCLRLLVPWEQTLPAFCCQGMLPGNPFYFRRTGAWCWTQPRRFVLVSCPCFPAYSAHLRWVGGGGGAAPGRDQQQAVSRLGLDVHSLSFTELKHCFAVLYL